MSAMGIDKLLVQGFSAISLQSVILLGCLATMDREGPNAFLSLALLFAVSLFCLQAMSKRFLWFYPVNGFHKVPTDDADTIILKTFSVLSVSLLLVGYVQAKTDAFSPVERILCDLLPVLGLLLVPALPLFWLKWGKQIARGRVVKRLKEKPVVVRESCQWRGGELKERDELKPSHEPHTCTVIYEVIDENRVETKTKCEVCGYEVIHQQSVPIGI